MTHRSWVGKNGELISQPTLTVEELRAIVDETHGWGKKVACHAYSGEGLQRGLDGGCDSIEHGLQLTDSQIAQMIRTDEYRPGGRLPTERDLVRQLGVSRPVIREAMIALEIAGLVEVRSGSGV